MMVTTSSPMRLRVFFVLSFIGFKKFKMFKEFKRLWGRYAPLELARFILEECYKIIDSKNYTHFVLK